MEPILIEISPGELIDRLTILRLRARHVCDPDARVKVERERAALEAAASRLPLSGELAASIDALAEVNAILWRAEDDVRSPDRSDDDVAAFAALARTIFRTNDRRSALKRRINDVLGSAAGEEKVYGCRCPGSR